MLGYRFELKWLSIRPSLGAWEIELKGLCWKPPRSFKGHAPFLARIEMMRLELFPGSLGRLVLLSQPQVLRIRDWTFDTVEVYFEKQNRLGQLNLWACCGFEEDTVATAHGGSNPSAEHWLPFRLAIDRLLFLNVKFCAQDLLADLAGTHSPHIFHLEKRIPVRVDHLVLQGPRDLAPRRKSMLCPITKSMKGRMRGSINILFCVFVSQNTASIGCHHILFTDKGLRSQLSVLSRCTA